jgi:hypothetical protein
MQSEMLPIGEPVFDVEDTLVIEAGNVEELDSTPDRPIAVLWLPDPEQRHGWREYYVAKHAAPKPGRPLGFRKPGT